MTNDGMGINLRAPDIHELKPRLMVFGVGGGGGNAVNNMIELGLQGVEFVVANTDAQALSASRAPRRIQMGLVVTEGLGAGAQPEVGRAAAEEVMDEIRDHLAGNHMVFITAGMGGGTGTGAAPIVARAARELGILTVGVVTKPFQFEGTKRMRLAEQGIADLQQHVDTLLIIPNQNLFRVVTAKTTFADAFGLADQVLYSGVASITDLMVKEGLINLDFADVRSVMREMGKAMMGTGEASGEGRALAAAEAAIANPLLDETSMRGARGLLISISGGRDLTLYEIDEAANRVRQEVDEDANVIFGATHDDSLEGFIRVSVVATGIDQPAQGRADIDATQARIAEATQRIQMQARSATPIVLQTPAAPSVPVVASPRPVSPERAQDALAAAVSAAQAAAAAHRPAPAAPAPEPEARPLARPDAFRPLARQETAAPAQPEAEPTRGFEPEAEDERAYGRGRDLFVDDRVALEAQPLPRGERAAHEDDEVVRSPRMPRVDELPIPAQHQLRARAEAAQPAPAPDIRRRSLLERLASVGLGRREDGTTQPAPVAVAAPTPAPRAVAALPSVHADYARRPPAATRAPQGQLDAHGRAPTRAPQEDDHLEIPAFLRRQAN